MRGVVAGRFQEAALRGLGGFSKSRNSSVFLTGGFRGWCDVNIMRRKCTEGEREEVGELVIAASSYLQNAAAVGVGTFSQQPLS